ncbi:MAG: MFS transporter [Gammaproteobacteria bacterium]|nr:MFS transporter [Gammaproteobacteria bacterium]
MNSEQLSAYYQAHPFARWAALIAVCIANFMGSLTLSATNVAIPAIALHFGATAVQVSWIPAIYLMTSVVLLLPAGRFADAVGRKRVLTTGVALFCLASVACSLAPDIYMLLGFRLVQAVGSSLTAACGLALVIAVFPAAIRGSVMGIAASFIYLGMTAGPYIGGYFTELYGWRSVFVMQVPLALLVIALLLTTVRGDWRMQTREPFDYFSVAVLAVTVSSLGVGLSHFHTTYGLPLLVLAAAALFTFIRRQLTHAYPLVRLKLVWENRELSRSFATSVMLYIGNYQVVFLLSLYLQYILGLSPSQAGAIMIVQALMMTLMPPFAGRLSDRLPANRIAALGCALASCGFAVLVSLDFDSSKVHVIAGLLLVGTGHGMFSTPNNHAGLSAVPHERLGIATAIMALGRNLGNVTGTGIILLLVSVFLGGERIQPAAYPALMTVIKIAFGTALLATLTASWISSRSFPLRTIDSARAAD